MESNNQEIQLKPMSEDNLAHQRSAHGHTEDNHQLHGYIEDQPKEWAILDYYLEVRGIFSVVQSSSYFIILVRFNAKFIHRICLSMGSWILQT